jgi:hypothetical protein
MERDGHDGERYGATHAGVMMSPAPTPLHARFHFRLWPSCGPWKLAQQGTTSSLTG